MDIKVFKKEVADLVTKLERVERFDYSEVNTIIWEFKKMVNKYTDYLNPYILEHITDITNSFERSKKYKRESLKISNWNDGYRGLLSDIQSMDSFETSFPEN